MKYKHQSFEGLNNLWVVTVVSNPQRYKSRYSLFNDFRERTIRAGANLMVVETAFGDRPFELTGLNNYHMGSQRYQELQLRTSDELWHKERMVNLAVERLPQSWEYVAWVDADVSFSRDDWATETVHQLQHYAVVQMWQSAVDLDPEGRAMNTVESFMASYARGVPRPVFTENYYASGHPEWHPGYAWAARRDAFDRLGGLIDTAILGAGDRHMAWALLGEVDGSIPGGSTTGYRNAVGAWAERSLSVVKKNVGVVPGTILHHWHGRKADRKYNDRWKILVDHQFDPVRDVRRDWQGLWAFTDRGERMRADMRSYFMARNEDSVDT